MSDVFTPEEHAQIERAMHAALEELGGICLRLRESRDGQAMPDAREEVANWLDSASGARGMIGRIVHYVLTKGPSEGESRAAIVTFSEEGSERISLTAFPAADRDGLGVTFSAFHVPHSQEGREPGTWHWPDRTPAQ